MFNNCTYCRCDLLVEVVALASSLNVDKPNIINVPNENNNAPNDVITIIFIHIGANV